MVLKQVDANVPVKKAYASRGKWSRAEPIAALYAEAGLRPPPAEAVTTRL